MKIPLLSFGSNHVDFGGINRFASATAKSSSMDVGYIENASFISLSARRSSSDKPRIPPIKSIRLSVLFPHDQLKILPYNRVVHDLNGYTADAFIDAVKADFEVEAVTEAYQPEEKAAFGMYLDGVWYKLRAKSHILSEDPVDGLDVSILQDHLLAPILGIEDPRTDKRIDFIGGIRGLAELERRADSDMKLAFSMYPTSIEELFAVADAKRLMPPKSTWFEPKLRSGIFIHKL